jgi:hypothetical protein
VGVAAGQDEGAAEVALEADRELGLPGRLQVRINGPALEQEVETAV